MKEHQFDVLLERAARQTTRRAALATLLGSALMLHNPAGSDATRAAERLKANGGKLKPTWVWLENPGPNPVTVLHGETRGYVACRFINRGVTIAPGARVPVAATYNNDSSITRAFVTINDQYWLVFDNPFLQRPDVSASFGGPPEIEFRPRCFGRPGTTVLRNKPMDVRKSVPISMDGHVFRVRRDLDWKHYKVFTVILPETL